MIPAILLLIILFLQASLGVFLEWNGVMIHFFPAVFYSIIPAVPPYLAIILALASGLLYDGLWGVYPGVYIVSYMLGTIAVRGLAYNLNTQWLPARIMISLAGLLVYAGVTGGLLYLLKQNVTVIRHIGGELAVQAIVVSVLCAVKRKQ